MSVFFRLMTSILQADHGSCCATTVQVPRYTTHGLTLTLHGKPCGHPVALSDSLEHWPWGWEDARATKPHARASWAKCICS